tara:strand:- start:1832 stop:2224 length:393 start_codon:yes stop_codon:yes gene_type:complete
MKVTKSHLKRLIKEELSQVLKEGVGAESPHIGKSVDEIAQWYLDKWKNMRMQFDSIPKEIMPPEKIEAMVQMAVDDTIDQIKYEPEIRQEYYPHLSDEEINELVSRIGGVAWMADARPGIDWEGPVVPQE